MRPEQQRITRSAQLPHEADPNGRGAAARRHIGHPGVKGTLTFSRNMECPLRVDGAAGAKKLTGSLQAIPVSDDLMKKLLALPIRASAPERAKLVRWTREQREILAAPRESTICRRTTQS